MAELIKTKINKKSPKFHECSPQRCFFKDESSRDVALQCRKCHRAVHYKCSRLPSYQIQLCLSFKERRYQCPNCIKVSQQVLEELELSRKDTIEINDSPKKKVNTINNNIDDNNNKNENKLNNRNTDNNNNNNSKKQSNELNINEIIEERLTKLESKVKHMLVEACEMKKEAQQKASYAKIAAIDINTTRDSGIELEVAEDEIEKTDKGKETKETSCNIIIHGVEELMDMDPKELEYEDRKYVENVIMEPMGIRSRPTRIQRIGILTQDRASKERYRPLKVSLESVEVKSQFLRNLTRLKGQFIKITEDLTKQERILVREWQDKASKKNEIEQNKTYKWRVRGSPRSRLYLKKVFCKNINL